MMEGSVAHTHTKLNHQHGAPDDIAGADVISTLVTDDSLVAQQNHEPGPNEALTLDIASSGGSYDDEGNGTDLATDYGKFENKLENRLDDKHDDATLPRAPSAELQPAALPQKRKTAPPPSGVSLVLADVQKPATAIPIASPGFRRRMLSQ